MFQKKLMSQSGENLRTEGRADGRTGGRRDPILWDHSGRVRRSKNENGISAQ